VRDILGHANIDVTQNVYGKSSASVPPLLVIPLDHPSALGRLAGRASK
jgi:hypothetical protein